MLQPLQDGLRDKSPYVRKTAVMGCVKLFYTSSSVIHECNIPDTLYAMLKDPDSLVVANCVVALEEILASEGGIVLTREIAHRLINGLQAFNEWCQCIVMGILIRYVPSNEDEVFDILNILEQRLKHANSGVVLVSLTEIKDVRGAGGIGARRGVAAAVAPAAGIHMRVSPTGAL